MNIEWLKNKTKEKFYPITHVKAVLFGNSNETLETKIVALDESIGTKANSSDLTDHTGNTNNPHNVTAEQTSYDNATSGLSAGNVQDAVDEVKKSVDDIEKIIDIQYECRTITSDDIGGMAYGLIVKNANVGDVLFFDNYTWVQRDYMGIKQISCQLNGYYIVTSKLNDGNVYISTNGGGRPLEQSFACIREAESSEVTKYSERLDDIDNNISSLIERITALENA